jgi:hypothetical protein
LALVDQVYLLLRLVKVVRVAHHRLELLFPLMAVAVAVHQAAQIVAVAGVVEHFPLAQPVLMEPQLLLLADCQTMQRQYQFKTVDLAAAAEQVQAQAATLRMAAVAATAGIPFMAAVVETAEHPFLAVLAVVLPPLEPRLLAEAVEPPYKHHPVQALVVKHVFGGSFNVTFCNH